MQSIPMLDADGVGSSGGCGGRKFVIIGALDAPPSLCIDTRVVVIAVCNRGPDVGHVLPPIPSHHPALSLLALPLLQPWHRSYHGPKLCLRPSHSPPPLSLSLSSRLLLLLLLNCHR